MKNIITRNKTWLLLLPVLVLLFSCNEKLDIKPKQEIDAEAALTTPDNIKTTLVGAYLTARDANLFGSQFNEFSELYATTGDMIFIGTYQQPGEFATKEVTVTNSYVENTWIDAYKLINVCNTIL
ncbi:MAG: RagB/SusD family nutrient uptake outer membrane protein, partial [Bacteroidales bacterium]|nr:RagB/SusD family nutrient uptake outer membrane protein [Bacteroidales bacterium]